MLLKTSHTTILLVTHLFVLLQQYFSILVQCQSINSNFNIGLGGTKYARIVQDSAQKQVEFSIHDESRLPSFLGGGNSRASPLVQQRGNGDPTKYQVRLKGGLEGPHAGFVQLFDGTQWRTACLGGRRNPTGFSNREAGVVCRQLGYVDGAVTEGVLGEQDSSKIAVFEKAGQYGMIGVDNVECRGDEKRLTQCDKFEVNKSPRCNFQENAISLVCLRAPISTCQYGSHPFRDTCYQANSANSRTGLDWERASNQCSLQFGPKASLVTISDEQESVFVKSLVDHVISTDPGGSSSTFWTGGQIKSQLSWPPYYETGIGTLRNNYIPPFVDKITGSSSLEKALIIDSDLHSPWRTEIVSKRHGYICQYEPTDVGCITGNGRDYAGPANITTSGVPCLKWNDPSLHVETVKNQKQWDDNFCRNPGGQEEKPFCLINYENEYDLCSVPECRSEESKRRSTFDEVNNVFSPNALASTSLFGSRSSHKCLKEHFECQPGECIFSAYVCDGESDCSNNSDEKGCTSFISHFDVEHNFRLSSSNLIEIVSANNEESCARACLMTKRCQCSSFSFINAQQRCFLAQGNSNRNPYDSLIQDNTSKYYTLKSTSSFVKMNGCSRSKRPAANKLEGIRLVERAQQMRRGRRESQPTVIEVKVNGSWGGICDDGFSNSEAKVVCKQLGFDLGHKQFLSRQGHDVREKLHLYDLQCEGGESEISECDFVENDITSDGPQQCTGLEKAGVSCRTQVEVCEQDHEFHCLESRECIHVNRVCDGQPDCVDESDENRDMCDSPTKIRLAGGESANSGRVEVRHRGIWGTICDDNFGETEAQVVCKMLGYDSSLSIATVYDGQLDISGERGPVWIRLAENETCSSTNGRTPDSIEHCKDKNLWKHEHHCSHDEDVGVTCQDVDYFPISSTSNRLDDHKKSVLYNAKLVLNDFRSGSRPIRKISSDVQEFEGVNKESKCGTIHRDVIRQIESDKKIRKRIYGGEESRPGQHPWQASIRLKNLHNSSFHLCGGAIISRRAILTAAHCVADFPTASYVIRVGDYALNVVDKNEEEFGVERIVMHDNYDVGPYLNNDVAIIWIRPKHEHEDGITFNKYVNSVCLPPANIIYQSNVTATISGWGQQGLGRNPLYPAPLATGSSINRPPTVGYLQSAEVRIHPKTYCSRPEVYGPHLLSGGMFCAIGDAGSADACKGDSGGPAVLEVGSEGRRAVIGITSWGFGCGVPNKPGVYTNVAKYLDWIQQELDKR